MQNFNKIRKEYLLKSLNIDDLKTDPFSQFFFWVQEAQEAGVQEPNAMALATVSKQGKPSCRMILLKKGEEDEFAFYTNLESRKAQDLAIQPFACGALYWPELERQIVIEGNVDVAERKKSMAYFSTRPRGSQIGAWISRQGQIIHSREELEKRFAEAERLYEGKEIPMPPFWGGYRLIPHRFEFWQGRPNRLHDRFRYLLTDGKWNISRLSP